MPRALKWIIAAVAALVVALAGLAVAVMLVTDRDAGALDTELERRDRLAEAATAPPSRRSQKPAEERPRSAGSSSAATRGDRLPVRDARLGLPAKKAMWTRGLGGYIEFPGAYCDGTFYVNTVEGNTFAIESETGKVRWRRQVGGTLPSSPAIDGPRLVVASQSGAVTALERARGRVVWRVQTGGKVESSPVAVDGLVYFGSHDGRLFAVHSRTGRVRWAYQTTGRINASPSVFRGRACVTTYAGSIVCVDARTAASCGRRTSGATGFRYESFYASPASDGRRIYSVARSGKVVALDARDGDVVWTAYVGGLGYTTPAVANGRVFAGGFDGRLRAFSSSTGAELWSRWAGGRLLGAPVVIGKHVFFSTPAHVRSRRASRTARSPGGCRWASTRRESRPSGRTTSRSTAA